MSELPILAASTYLNSAPVVHAFSAGSQSSRCRITADAAPSACARLLAEDSVDAALIPVIEYQRIPGLAIARDVCIGAREEVRSVVLLSACPLQRVRRVALDLSSRTSAALIRILFRRFERLSPEFIEAPPVLDDMLAQADAALLIGDPAMTADVRGLDRHDVAALWRERTGHPFVFAVWARPLHNPRALLLDFAAARDEGLCRLEAIARQHTARLGLPVAQLVDYLESCINYRLDEPSLRGLETFFDLALEEQLIDTRRPLLWFP